jgi:hypothetical protein
MTSLWLTAITSRWASYLFTPNRATRRSQAFPPTLPIRSVSVLLLSWPVKALPMMLHSVQTLRSLFHSTRAYLHQTVRPGVPGNFSSSNLRALKTEFIHIQMVVSRDRSSTHAFRPVRSTITQATAVSGRTAALVRASQASTVKMRRRCVRMHTVMVSWTCRPDGFMMLIETVAFDDQTSTFIIPSGGGFEVIFCPAGRSTTILTTMSNELHQLHWYGKVTQWHMAEVAGIAVSRWSNDGAPLVPSRRRRRSLSALVAAATFAVWVRL